jgi:hypothetical protein
MGLLTTAHYRDQLFGALRLARTSIRLASAYITVPGIEAILQPLTGENVCVRVLARWDAHDLASGASDLEVYETVIAHGHEFFINPRLHGKFVLIDDFRLFIGSANITASGLQLGIQGNLECGTEMAPSETDIAVVQDFFVGATLMTPPLYEAIRQFIGSMKSALPYGGVMFPASIMEQLLSAVEGLWVRELPWTTDPLLIANDSLDAAHDRLLLRATPEVFTSVEQMGHYFEETRCCRWLIAKLRENGGQLYFGAVTVFLHDALLEDPKPYRKDIKMLVRNLFMWASITLPQRFVADAPNHSQRITLVASDV